MVAMEERVSRLEGAYEQVDRRLGRIGDEIRDLRSDVNSRIEGVEGRIEGVEGRIEGLRGEMNSRIDGVEGRIDETNRAIEGLRTEMNGQIEGLRGEMNRRMGSLGNSFERDTHFGDSGGRRSCGISGYAYPEDDVGRRELPLT